MDSTNPKDLIGQTKVPLGLLPAAAQIYGALAMQFGAERYGPFNWRTKEIRLTVYLDAIERHMVAFRDGQNCASDSGVHHMGHIIANCAIVLDAMGLGKLIDDRTHDGPGAALLEKFIKTK